MDGKSDDSDSPDNSASEDELTGRELAPTARRAFGTVHPKNVVYAWYEQDDDGKPQKRVVKGTIVKVGKLKRGADKWDRKYDVDFGPEDGNGIFPYNHGDLFSDKAECEKAYSAYTGF